MAKFIAAGLCGGLGVLVLATVAPAQTPAPDMKVMIKAAAEGAKTWAAVCESCHGPPNPRTPPRTALLEMTADHIYEALTVGKMKAMGDTISDSERRSVSIYLTGKPLTAAATPDVPPVGLPAPGAAEPTEPAPTAPPAA